MRINSVKLFWIWVSGSREDVVLKNSYLELWRPSCSVDQNHLCSFEREHHGKHSCEVLWNLDQWLRRRCRLKKKFTDGRTEGWRTKTNRNSHRLRWANKTRKRETVSYTKQLVHSLSVNIRILQTLKVMFTSALPRWTSLFLGLQIPILTSKECISYIIRG